MKNDKIERPRTLSMAMLNVAHTGEYIATLLQNTFIEYEINPIQIYTITTDNGTNLLNPFLTRNFKTGIFSSNFQKELINIMNLRNKNKNSDKCLGMVRGG